MAEFYVEQQYLARWPKVLIMCRKNGRDVTHRRYVPEVETGEGMSITKELREWVKSLYTPNSDQLKREAYRIADRIDAEHERACAEAYGNGVMSVPIALDESQWVQLPKDADGEPWRLGDELMMEGEVCEVVGIGGKTIFYAFGDGVEWTIAHNNRHHHAPTVEDVLREFAVRVAGDECVTMRTDVIAEYASKLQLRGEDA